MIVLIIAIPFTIAALQLVLDIGSEADETKHPKEIVVSNITESSAVISWTTQTETEGYVKYGTSADNLNLLGSDKRDLGKETAEAYKEHIVEVINLSPTTTYHIQVYADGETQDTYIAQFQTRAVSESVALPKTIKGKTSTQRAYSLVYVFASNGRDVSEVRSTYTAANGTFTYDISNLMSSDGSTPFSLDSAKLVTYVNALEAGKARKVHGTSEDAGTMTLDKNSDLVFTTEVSIDGDDPPTPTPTPTPTPVEKTPGINIMKQVYNDTKANSDPTVPTNVFVSNVSETSFQINWITKEPTRGYVEYGKTTSLGKRMLDNRDSSAEVTRYTHAVTITDSALTAKQSVYFKINSNGKRYGVSGGSKAYEFVAPAILSSPPSPKAFTGQLEYLQDSRLSGSKRDFLIYGKVQDSSETTSTFISTVPAYNSEGWTLSIGGARNEALTSVVDAAKVNLFVLGEYNSVAEGNFQVSENSVSIKIDPGLSIDSIRHNVRYSAVPVIKGTAKPSSTVSINIDSARVTAEADTEGEWEALVSGLRTGEHDATFSDGSQTLGLTFVVTMSNLPATAIDGGILVYAGGIGLVLVGLTIVYFIKKKLLVA